MKMRNEKQIQSANPSALVDRIFGNLRGFTQLDLMAVIAVMGVLFLIMLPALAKPGVNSKTAQCLNNHRQLCNAWRMYADDNSDVLLYASTGGGRLGTSVNWTSDRSNPDNYAWSGAHMDFNGGNRANWDPTLDMQKRPLWAYNKSLGIYKCPSDQSYISVVGVNRPRILSMSMNLYVGGYAPAVNSGSLLGNDGGWPFAAPYRIFSKTTDLTAPGPAKTFVFIDMRPDAINWSNFMQDMTGYSPNDPGSYTFADVPGMYHNRAAGFSFADGHTEMKRWMDSRTIRPLFPNGQIASLGASPNNPDIGWLQSHSTVLK